MSSAAATRRGGASGGASPRRSGSRSSGCTAWRMGRCGWDGCRRGSTAGSRRARSTPSSDCMDLRDRTAMILGGSGLVGHAVARRLLAAAPRRVVLVALFEDEVRATARALEPDRGRATIEVEWGNVFLPASLAQLERGAIMASAAHRRLMLEDLLSEFTDDILHRSFLYQLLLKYKPDAVVDSINTATAFAYQDPLKSAEDLLALAADGQVDRAAVERHVLLLTMPQLIRHVQILVEALRRAETKAYVKIGTSGTGGMGFNIPYTHSEERPSRPLLTKSAVAGAQSLLLFLLGRTPRAPATVEIKPTATIAWREIGFGPIRRKGKPIPLVDCPAPVELAQASGPSPSLGRRTWPRRPTPASSATRVCEAIFCRWGSRFSRRTASGCTAAASWWSRETAVIPVPPRRADGWTCDRTSSVCGSNGLRRCSLRTRVGPVALPTPAATATGWRSARTTRSSPHVSPRGYSGSKTRESGSSARPWRRIPQESTAHSAPSGRRSA